MSGRRNTRYPHAFSKGAGVPLTSDDDRRGRAPEGPANGVLRVARDRSRLLKVSPTIANLYKGNLGVAVICADCQHGVAHRNPGLPDHFRREWRLTLIEIEQRRRCGRCGSRNARVYPWWGDAEEGALGLEGQPVG